jgi:hypothetical protein
MGWPHPSILLAALTAVDVSPPNDSAAPLEALSFTDLVNGADLLQSAVSDDGACWNCLATWPKVTVECKQRVSLALIPASQHKVMIRALAVTCLWAMKLMN